MLSMTGDVGGGPGPTRVALAPEIVIESTPATKALCTGGVTGRPVTEYEAGEIVRRFATGRVALDPVIAIAPAETTSVYATPVEAVRVAAAPLMTMLPGESVGLCLTGNVAAEPVIAYAPGLAVGLWATGGVTAEPVIA